MRRPLFGLAFLLFLIIATSFSGCSSKPTIIEINQEPYHWEGKEVTLTGVVGRPEPIYGANSNKTGYYLGEGNYIILVITDPPVPQQGTQITVKGTVELNYDLGGSIARVVIIETQRN